MAGRSVGRHAHEHRVIVTVVRDLDDVHRVARRLTLLPQLLARAREEVDESARTRERERLVVHPAQHQDATRGVVLDNRRSKFVAHITSLIGRSSIPRSFYLTAQTRQSGRVLVHDRRDQRGVGDAQRAATCAAEPAPPGRDDRDRHRVTHRRGQRQVEAFAASVVGDRGQAGSHRRRATPPRRPTGSSWSSSPLVRRACARRRHRRRSRRRPPGCRSGARWR